VYYGGTYNSGALLSKQLKNGGVKVPLFGGDGLYDPQFIALAGNADGDLFDNLHEYAFNLSPTNANSITNAPLFSLVTTNDERYGAFTFTLYKPGTDLSYEPVAKSQLAVGEWDPLTNIVSVVDNGLTETVTVRDIVANSAATNRFYQLRLKLKDP
jgi:hypothetical protein